MSALEPSRIERARQEIRGLTPRVRQLGRIRIGETVQREVTRKGKRVTVESPAKLDHFRVTSPFREPLEKLAKVHGGEVKPWSSPNGEEFEVHLATDVIDIAIPPDGMDLTQRYELWSAAGRQRSCDGYDCLLPDGKESACLCPIDPAERIALAQDGKACSIKTRINVILPDSGHIGFWRLDTGSWNAAQELLGTLEMLRRWNTGLAAGKLRLEHRSVKRIKDGRPTTQPFIVPVIELPEIPRGVLAGSVDLVTGEIAAGEPPRALQAPAPEPAADHSSSPLDDVAAAPALPQATAKQKQRLAILAGELGWDDANRREAAGVESFNELDREHASALIEQWTQMVEELQASAAEPPGRASTSASADGADDPPAPGVGELPQGSAGSASLEAQVSAELDRVFGRDASEARREWIYDQFSRLTVATKSELTDEHWRLILTAATELKAE